MNEDNWSNAIDPDEAPESAFDEASDESVIHETVFDDDGSYRIVRPQASESERSYTDASYREAADAEIPPRYYTPDPPRARAPKTEKKGGFMKAACLALCCALLGGAVGGVIGTKTARASTGAIQQVQAAPAESAAAETAKPATAAKATAVGTMTASDIYAAACQQVVGITTEVTTQNFFGQTTSAAVMGSGFIISSDGYILTNQHVISYAEAYGYDVTVMTYDGTSYTAKIVGSYASNDLAVLKIDAEGLTPVTFGDSDSVSVGDTVYAVGNPLGELAYSMSTGHVSALDRTITTDESTAAINMFQIDAAVNEGNSGGPAYNDQGQVIGIVSAKASSSGVEGLGFAIPVNDAVSIANELIENGVVTNKVELGVSTQTIPSNVAKYYNMVEGAYLVTVEDGSCAQKAGLQIGDIITAIEGKSVTSSEALRAALRGYNPGDTVEITFYRAGETQTASVTLDAMSQETIDAQKAEQQKQAEQAQQQQQQPQMLPDPWSSFFGNP